MVPGQCGFELCLGRVALQVGSAPTRTGRALRGRGGAEGEPNRGQPGPFCVGGWAGVPLRSGQDGSAYEEELVEFLPHGLAHVLLHHWERLHEELRPEGGRGGVTATATVTASARTSARSPHRRGLTSSVRLASLWLLLWSVLPMAAIRLCTTRMCSISSAALMSLRARTLGRVTRLLREALNSQGQRQAWLATVTPAPCPLTQWSWPPRPAARTLAGGW